MLFSPFSSIFFFPPSFAFHVIQTTLGLFFFYFAVMMPKNIYDSTQQMQFSFEPFFLLQIFYDEQNLAISLANKHNERTKKKKMHFISLDKKIAETKISTLSSIEANRLFIDARIREMCLQRNKNRNRKRGGKWFHFNFFLFPHLLHLVFFLCIGSALKNI